MEIKVLYSYPSLLLILLFLLVKVLNAEAKDDIRIKFLLKNAGGCTQDKGGRTHWHTEVGSNLSISVSGKYYINLYKIYTCQGATRKNCTADGKFMDPNNEDKVTTHNNATEHHITIQKITLKKHMEGLWICRFLTNKDTALLNTVQYEGHNYTQNDCHFNVTFKEDLKSNGTASDPQAWIYITSGTVSLFTIIILVQTCIIIYCKVKAQRVTRIQSLALSVRSSSSQEDKKRYSATPSRRNRISELFGKGNQKDETCIYETLEEIHAGHPPTPPIETIPTLKRKPSDLNVRKRPPVPLPKEVSDDDDDITNSMLAIHHPSCRPIGMTLQIGSNRIDRGWAWIEPKAKPPKILSPLPESPTKPEPKIKPKPLKPKPGPSIVASELDDIFKRRQHASQPVPSGAIKLPVTNSSQNKPDQKFEKSGSFTSNINPFSNAGKSKKSLPDIKPHRMIDTEKETPEVQSSVVTQRPQTKTLNRSSPKPAGIVEPPNPGTLRKKPLPPVPAPNPVSQPPVPPIPVEAPSHALPGTVPRSLPDVQESVYEPFDEEEPVYNNSDEEWTYEPLRQYNIYSA